MKINKAKLLVGTLAVAAVAATVGSISGTVAWFQYSTRVTAAYSGAAAHVSENLQIRLFRANTAEEGQPSNGYDSGWKADLSRADINAYIANVRPEGADHNLRPITSGAALDSTGKAATSFYKSPIYQISGAYDDQSWEAATALDYVELPIELRVLDRNGKTTDEFLAKDVFLTDLTIAAETVSGKENITDALRVSFDTADNDVTFSKKGEIVATSGNLDLNADTFADKEAGYEWENPGLFTYGGTTGSSNQRVASVEKTTKLEKSDADNSSKTYWADDADPKAIYGNKLGATTKTNVFQVTVRIYLEGWQLLGDDSVVNAAIDKTSYANLAALQADTEFEPEDGKTYKTGDGKIHKWTAGQNEEPGAYSDVADPRSAIWDDDKYVDAAFNIGMRFSVNAHDDATDHAA